MREAYLEQSCCIHARKQGCFPVKLSDGITGVPDRLFLLPGGRLWLVEFKGKGGTLTPRQRLVHEQLAALGHVVDVVYNREQFTKLLALKLQADVD